MTPYHYYQLFPKINATLMGGIYLWYGIHEEEIRTFKMQLSGGQLLTPVRKLVATLICESPRVHQTS